MENNPASGHIRTAGGLHIALGVLAILMALLFIVVIPVVQGALDIAEEEAHGEDRDAIQFAKEASTSVLLFLGLVVGVVGAIGIIGGQAMVQGKPSGKGWGYTASALQLLNLPFGTAVAIYAFVALGMEGADQHFEGA